MSNPNLTGTNFCVQNRQVFGLFRLKKIPTLLKISLHMIPVYSGFGLDSIHCILFQDVKCVMSSILFRHDIVLHCKDAYSKIMCIYYIYVFMLFIYNKASGWNKITLHVYLVVHCDVLMDIQRKFKQLWSTISTKRTTKSHTKL